jgi:hypothetical protein
MTTSALGIGIIVIVVAVGLVVWITGVFRAEKHPETGRGGAPRRKVTGGIFQGDPRQQMPHRDTPAEVMGKDHESGTGD